MPEMSLPLALAFLRPAFVAAQTAFHQSAGSCSDHPGFGDEMGCSAIALARTLPSSSQMRVLVPLVPISMPSRKPMGGSPCGVAWQQHCRSAVHSGDEYTSRPSTRKRDEG